VPVPSGEQHHRYWRIVYDHVHPGGYWPGLDNIILRLLYWDGDPTHLPTCRLNTPNRGSPNPWYSVAVKPWTGDVSFTGAVSPGGLTLYGGPGQGSSNYGVNATVSGAIHIEASWTFDIG